MYGRLLDVVVQTASGPRLLSQIREVHANRTGLTVLFPTDSG